MDWSRGVEDEKGGAGKALLGGLSLKLGEFSVTACHSGASALPTLLCHLEHRRGAPGLFLLCHLFFSEVGRERGSSHLMVRFTDCLAIRNSIWVSPMRVARSKLLELSPAASQGS